MALNKYKGFIPGDKLPAENVNSIDPNESTESIKPAMVTKSFNGVNIDVLVVGGGGSGASQYGSNNNCGGGGGGGALVFKENYSLKAKDIINGIAVTVGNGGNAVSANRQNGNAGGNSQFLDLIAFGGGAGAYTASGIQNGGCGGGGCAVSGNLAGGVAIQKTKLIGDSNTYSFAFAGGNASGTTTSSGGGGGAGSAGSGSTPGAGKTIWGVTYSAGGQGGSVAPVAGGANTGNGGSSANTGVYNANAGGSGVVKFRVLTSDIYWTSTNADATVVDGLYTYYTITSSKTLKFYINGHNMLDDFLTLKAGANNGKFSATINGVLHSDISVNLSAVTDYATLQTAINTAIRAVTGNKETFSIDESGIHIYADQFTTAPSISKLSSPSTGTDISGNGATPYLMLGNDAVVTEKYLYEDEIIRSSSNGIPPAFSSNNSLLGDGSDGDVYITVNTTLTANKKYRNLFIDAGISLNTSGYQVSISGALVNFGTIHNNGQIGSGTSGGIGGGAGVYLGGATGGTGRNNGGGGGGGGIVVLFINKILIGGLIQSLGAVGIVANSDAGSSSPGGSITNSIVSTIGGKSGGILGYGGEVAGGTVTNLRTIIELPDTVVSMFDFKNIVPIAGGVGGGGSGQNGYGSGGGGGGIVFVFYKNYYSQPTISCEGGLGGFASSYVNYGYQGTAGYYKLAKF